MTMHSTSRRPTRREFTLGALGGAAAAVLTACGGPDGGDTDTTGSTTDPSSTTGSTGGVSTTIGSTAI